MKTSMNGLGALMAALMAAASAPAETATVVKVTDGPGLKRAVAAQKGRVTVVNLWATWCGPCVEEFPALVKLHNTYKGKGLRFVSVTVDEPGDKGKVVSFINRQRASFPVFIRRGGDVEPYVSALDPNWSGAVPVTYLFDGKGRMIGRPISGSRSYVQLEAAVKPHL